MEMWRFSDDEMFHGFSKSSCIFKYFCFTFKVDYSVWEDCCLASKAGFHLTAFPASLNLSKLFSKLSLVSISLFILIGSKKKSPSLRLNSPVLVSLIFSMTFWWQMS